MERWQKGLIAVLVTVALGLSLFSLGFTFGRRHAIGDPVAGRKNASGLRVIQDAYRKIRSTAVDPPSADALARGAVKGMVQVLKRSEDPYALFYTPEGYRSFQELTTGSFSGIGVWLKEKGGDLEIVSVLPSTPALEGGLERGDVIRTIDDEPVEELTTDEAVARIKGPEGTDVTLGIDRGGDSLEFTITRAAIELPNLVSEMPEDDLGYVRLFGFARGAGKQVRDEIEGLVDKGAEGIVLDLRDNGGGLFSEAINVASVFIDDGEIVTYRERSSPDVVYEAEGDAFEELPLVVLVNEGTASASEIVAGALKDEERAIIIGTTTYGKGSVQQVFPLLDASALKFTTAAYLTPDGVDINGRGIEPDVEVDADPVVQRERAFEILKGIVISITGAQG